MVPGDRGPCHSGACAFPSTAGRSAEKEAAIAARRYAHGMLARALTGPLFFVSCSVAVGCGGGGVSIPDAAVVPGDTGAALDAADASEAIDAARGDAGSDGGSGGGLGGSTGIRFVYVGRPVDLTPDGTLAVIEDPSTTTTDAYFYRVDTGELRVVTGSGDPTQDFATGISADEALVALHGVPVQAGVWTQAGGWVDLPSPFTTGCDVNVASAWDVSSDGTSVVGMAWEDCHPAAIRWARATDGTATAHPLDRLGSRPAGAAGMPTNRASAVADDGSLIGGFAETEMADRWPAIWHADGTGMLLPGTMLDAPGEVLAVSADGSMVAGTWNLEAFVWTEAGGVVSLGVLPGSLGGDAAYANAIAADGALVFGGSGSLGALTAFVWTEADGMRPLADVVSAAGIDLPSGTVLQNVVAASTDGTVILGSAATASGATQSFVARLPLSAYGL